MGKVQVIICVSFCYETTNEQYLLPGRVLNLVAIIF